MKTVKKILGWIMLILGGLTTLSGLLCTLVSLVDGSEFGYQSLGEQVVSTVGFALLTVLFWQVGKAGSRLKGGQKPAQTIQQSPMAEPEADKVWHMEREPDWLHIPDLNHAIESGPIGRGGQHSHRLNNGDMEVTCDATSSVKYHYFSDGLLVFSGKGETKTVDPGGHDGRVGYMPEKEPWPDLVSTGTRRLVVRPGVTSIGSGLLNSLRNLEEINLADSITTIDTNQCSRVRILRTGCGFKRCDMLSGDLEELILHGNGVHIGRINQTLRLYSSRPEIQQIINSHTIGAYQALMHELYRLMPKIGTAMGRLGAYDVQAASDALFSVSWNSRYKTTRTIPEKDLWALLALDPRTKTKGKLDLTISSHYGYHFFVLLGALLFAAPKTGAKELDVKADYYLKPSLKTAVAQWWPKEMPGVALRITQLKSGEVLVDTTHQP